jgi:hypothetical protein
LETTKDALQSRRERPFFTTIQGFTHCPEKTTRPIRLAVILSRQGHVICSLMTDLYHSPPHFSKGHHIPIRRPPFVKHKEVASLPRSTRFTEKAFL